MFILRKRLAGLKSLNLYLKSKAWSIQYSLETAGLTKYRNSYMYRVYGEPRIPMTTLPTYLQVQKESWSYPAKGNLCTIGQFVKELEGCPDLEQRKSSRQYSPE